ncbi:hypothetical protein D3C75_816490 [compost metagenome]
MQGVATGLDGQVDQLARVQVAGQRLVAEVVGFVGALDVQRMAVGFGIHGHRADAHLGAGPHDTHGNLATVGDEDFSYHGGLPRFGLADPAGQATGANTLAPRDGLLKMNNYWVMHKS